MSTTPPEQPAGTSRPTMGMPSIPSGARMPIPGNAEFALWFVIEVILVLIWIIADSVDTQQWSIYTVVLTSFAVPGIPFGSIIAMVPVLNAANVPVEGIGILLAVDTIPDMFRTTENVTGSLALAAVLATATRRERSDRAPSPEG